MATIQSKITNGHKYWYIVESRRINGKPRPVVLEYLGKADSLLKRLKGLNDYKLKSYSHGHIAALLDLCEKLDICNIINNYAVSQRTGIADKPIRHNLTVGGTLMLAILMRACLPVSKDGFIEWAKGTSLTYMTGISLCKVNSQHFWDMMDCLPVAAIPDAESEIIKKVSDIFELDTERILYDTTNYYTYINTENYKAPIAKRGKNKQKRDDLRQVGLALVVTKKDMIPVFHQSYNGNWADSDVFKNVLGDIIKRMAILGVDINSQTVVFDKGVNSKKNLEQTQSLHLHFVGSLSSSHCKEIVCEAESELIALGSGACYRSRRMIWGLDLTVVVTISDKLKIGLIRGIYTSIEKCDAEIVKINSSILKPKAKKTTSEQLMSKVKALLKKHKATNYVEFNIIEDEENGKHQVNHRINYQSLANAEDAVGFKVIITTRHEWDTLGIVQAYHGQAYIENSFKNMKAPQHLSLRPQFHWTNHKIRVHNFCCVIGYLLNALLYKQAREKANYTGCMGSFLGLLDNIRLGSVIYNNDDERGKPRVEYSIEAPEEKSLQTINIFNLNELHKKRPSINGISKY